MRYLRPLLGLCLCACHPTNTPASVDEIQSLAEHQETKSEIPKLSVNQVLADAKLLDGRTIRVRGLLSSGGFGKDQIGDAREPHHILSLGSEIGSQIRTYSESEKYRNRPAGKRFEIEIEGVFSSECSVDECTDMYSDFKSLRLIDFKLKD
jgi:hypothetical protein